MQLDGGAWQPANLGRSSIKDSWVQWDATLDVASGDHQLRVRAVNDDGEVQTAVKAEPAPNGASGWDAVSFTAELITRRPGRRGGSGWSSSWIT